MTSTIHGERAVVDPRAVGAVPSASRDVVDLWQRVTQVTAGDLPGMGLLAGDRPTADVEVLAGAYAAVEYELARRMHAATIGGSLPLVGPGAVLGARRWATPHARRLARAGALAADHPTVAAAWAAGIITSDHVEAIARHCERLESEETGRRDRGVVLVVGGSVPGGGGGSSWPGWCECCTHPRTRTPTRRARIEGRSLSFALTGDAVVLSGVLPRLEGEAVIAAVEAFAERMRTEADHVPASARRADGLVALVNTAHATGSIPTRGGLPVSVSVTLESTAVGDQVWTTSRGHTLTAAEARFTACDAQVTPIVVDTGRCPDTVAELLTTAGQPAPGRGDASADPTTDWAGTVLGVSSAQRITALATTLLGTRIPLAVGRTARTATPAQRRALAARDKGCIIPGCGIPAEACQTHHVEDWAAGGNTDLPNLALLCWAHHRQVDLGMWTIDPAPTGDDQVPRPEPGAPPGTPWPANNGAPWTITRTPRTRWRQ